MVLKSPLARPRQAGRPADALRKPLNPKPLNPKPEATKGLLSRKERGRKVLVLWLSGAGLRGLRALATCQVEAFEDHLLGSCQGAVGLQGFCLGLEF